jgi:hypothetical protein
MAQPRQSPQRPRRAGNPGAAVVDDGPNTSDGTLCTCCEPKNPLVMRPDLGTLSDHSPEYAICVLHQPDPVVYRNRGDGVFVQMPELALNAAGDIVDAAGNIIARVSGDGFQRLSTVDDDEPPAPDSGGGAAADPGPAHSTGARPATFHVDLSQDDFYT